MAPKTNPRRAPSRTERRQQALHRRRQQATARTAAARRSARRKRTVKGAAAFVAIAALAGGAVTFLTGDDDGASTELRAKKVSGASGRLAMATLPVAYHAVYRAEGYQGSETTVSTEDVSVQRPFDGKVSIREGEPPGTKKQFEGRSQFSVYANFTEAGAAKVAGDAPTVALGDVRVGSSLDDLVAVGLFVPGDRRRAMLAGAVKGGRECQTYRTGSPLQSLKITAPTETDYVDVCLDETGLILEEVTVVGRKLTQRLTATTLDLDPTIDPAGFAIEGDRIGQEQGGNLVTEVDKTMAPGPGYWALDAPPSGFTQKGRYLVAGTGSSYIDVYVRGIDIVTIRQGSPAGEPNLTDAGPGRDVELGPLGSGKLLLRTVGPTFVARPGSDGFVHVTGTISPTELQRLATSLRKG